MRRATIAVAAVMLVLTAGESPAYWYDGPRWAANPVMSLQLGAITSGATLIDGSTTWGQPAESAMSAWNDYLDAIKFRVIRDSTAATGLGNGVNNVFWSSTIYGRSFTPYAGYTLWLNNSAGAIYEADIIMNNQTSWNSFRGNTRPGIVDFRRLIMHELGHALGLNHPNEHGQVVNAVMNSSPGNTDDLRADDISAAQFLYSLGNGTVSFPARNESLDFRNQLESKYRDSLGRGNSSTFVDREGDIVWTSEYYRYRVNGCTHTQAQTRVFAQIDNTGTFGVCGSASAGSVAFPPRNESLQFRNALEAKYRDELRRGASQSVVDLEGDVVWIQEYLRYRVNACSHAVAIDKVFAQIDGRGVQATCR